MVDITKPLIKFLYFKQEEDENEMDSEEQERRENKANGEEKAKEILMPVSYERLPDFCYIHSQIGHQYRECVNYKNQLREEMAYEPWMKAPTMTEQLKQNKRKENIRPEQGKKSQSYSTMEVQDKKGNSETNDGTTQKLGKTDTGQEPSRGGDSLEMSNQNSKKQLVTKKVNWRREGINLRREVRNKLRGKKKKKC